MNIMICFEVSEKQEQVRKELASMGYLSSWRIARGRDAITFNLPSTAMWKKGENMSPTKAKEDLKKITGKLNVKAIRAIAVALGKCDGITGDLHTAESAVSEHAEEV